MRRHNRKAQEQANRKEADMKRKDVEVGRTYLVKVSGRLVPVRLEAEHPNGGWTGVNKETRRQVRVRTAARLRCEHTANTN
jgi:hypothetical protein